MLFVGNSYTFVNDVPGHYRALVAGPVRIEEVSAPGYRLEQHAADADADGTALARWLRTGSPADTSFDAIVLQEQSTIGGRREREEVRMLSTAAASHLAALARSHGARVVLYLTWGRERGVPDDTDYPTFEAMQDRLDVAYRNLAERLRSEGSDVEIAPVGAAFRNVFDDVMASADPLAEGSDFDALYEPDGSHPSPRGAYLAACVIAATITHADPRGLPDDAVLGDAVSAALRDACARAVADPRWSIAPVERRDATLEITPTSPDDVYGCSVALSPDGNRALFGASAMNYVSGIGFFNVHSFRLETGGWTGERIVSSPEPWALFGDRTVAWSSERALFATPPNSETGRMARVFRREGARFVEESPLVTADPSSGASWAGVSMALDGSGTRAIIGASTDPRFGVGSGSARIFSLSSEGTTEEALLTPSETSAFDGFGTAVAMSADGNTVLVGAPRTDSGSGRALIFVRDAEGWQERVTLVSSSAAAEDRFGASLALSADGQVALVGRGAGGHRVDVFVRGDLEWTAAPSPVGREDVQGFGASVALSSDGARALIGASMESNAFGLGAGAAYLFERDATGWTERARMLPGIAGSFVGFGQSVALGADGRRAVVCQATPSGSAVGYVFDVP